MLYIPAWKDNIRDIRILIEIKEKSKKNINNTFLTTVHAPVMYQITRVGASVTPF